MGAIIRLTLGFFFSVVFHLLIVGGLLWLGHDLTRPPTQVEPEAMVLDLTMFAEPSQSASVPTGAQKKVTEPTLSEDKPTPKTKSAPVRRSGSPKAFPLVTSDSDIQSKQQTSPTHRSGSPDPDTHPKQQQLLRQIERMPKEQKEQKNKKIKTKQATRSSQASARRQFIRHNLSRIMRISQRTLRRLGIPRVRSRRRHVRATVSFRLHPNGSISGLHIKRRSGLQAIDRRTLQVIRRAHRHYPRPTVPVKINITMRYGL